MKELSTEKGNWTSFLPRNPPSQENKQGLAWSWVCDSCTHITGGDPGLALAAGAEGTWSSARAKLLALGIWVLKRVPEVGGCLPNASAFNQAGCKVCAHL